MFKNLWTAGNYKTYQVKNPSTPQLSTVNNEQADNKEFAIDKICERLSETITTADKCHYLVHLLLYDDIILCSGQHNDI